MLTAVERGQWPQVKELYQTAFPKAERKPFWMVRNAVRRGKVQLLTVAEDNGLAGFIAVIPYGDMLMVDYLAVAESQRGRGTGSAILQELEQRCPGKRIVLLIERPEEGAVNQSQRLARRRFYLKNGFDATGLFMRGVSGAMEILSRGGRITAGEYMSLQRHALGTVLFRLSGIALTA